MEKFQLINKFKQPEIFQIILNKQDKQIFKIKYTQDIRHQLNNILTNLNLPIKIYLFNQIV